MTDVARSRDEFETALREIGKSRYHDLHPFHHLLHGGELDQGQVQAWALNRFYYQINIPRKDLTLTHSSEREGGGQAHPARSAARGPGSLRAASGA